ncbi:MAG: hypothetical protein ABSF94_12940 [Steroidobacteraceae bacterium]|jgi:hypothetical protein
MPADNAVASQETARKEATMRGVIDEFGRLLEIFSAQLAESLHEADRDCTTVGDSFHDLAHARSNIERVACPEPQASVLQRECAQIDASIGAAVVALQYHDRLTQRIGHIRVGLNHLQKLLRHQAQRTSEEWLELLQNVDRTYHLEWHRLAHTAPTGRAAGAADAPAAGDNSSVELF